MSTPKRYENAKWEDVSPVVKEAFEAMLKGGKSIYLHGAVGTGKTHTCWAIKMKYDQPQAYRYMRIWNVVDLMHKIRQDFDRQSYDKRRPEEELTDRDERERRVLILDDLGAEKATEFVAETLYRIINFRYVNILPTIITSNCTVQELADKIGERSASRIVEMCEIIELTGGDRRMTK
jgi:DNA replication protein DnaC